MKIEKHQCHDSTLLRLMQKYVWWKKMYTLICHYIQQIFIKIFHNCIGLKINLRSNYNKYPFSFSYTCLITHQGLAINRIFLQVFLFQTLTNLKEKCWNPISPDTLDFIHLSALPGSSGCLAGREPPSCHGGVENSLVEIPYNLSSAGKRLINTDQHNRNRSVTASWIKCRPNAEI